MERNYSYQGAYVSNYFRVNPVEIQTYFNRNKLEFRIQGEEFAIRECPFCHDTKGKADNMFKLYVSRLTGAYFCHRCGNKGSWYDFKVKLDQGPSGQQLFSNTSDLQEKKVVEAPDANLCLQYRKNLFKKSHSEIIEYLKKERGLKPIILKKFFVGASLESYRSQDHPQKFVKKLSITFPMWAPDPKSKNKELITVRHKKRALQNKKYMKLDPAGGRWGLFGLNLVPDDCKEIVLTEGEFDAMAVFQGTGKFAVSVPNGCRSLPVEVLPLLERFEKIYLWMDDDAPGQHGVEQFANKLGISRCLVVKSCYQEDLKSSNTALPKDANEALLAGKSLKKLLREAQHLANDQIANFNSFKSDIFRELYGSKIDVTGIKSRYLPQYNQLLKGIRRGELTIFTGPTGVGKTTILSQMTLDFAEQGMSTLWGSFEIRNHRLISHMLCQLAGKDIREYKDRFEIISDHFEQLPMYFMNFFGSTNVDHVISAMDYAVYVMDVQHIVIDNLQFMMSGQGSGIDKFELQDRAIEKLRKFATQRNVHITVVVHPRKEADRTHLGLSSVFGTAKATQEADNVLIIQNNHRGYRSLSVKKNRFDGTLGEIPYRFIKSSRRIMELSPEEVEQIESGRLVLSY